jgi:hypothetical protein
MKFSRRLLILVLSAIFTIGLFSPAVSAGGNEYDAVCDHLENKYSAKKVKIPFMWLARFAVGIVRPAGVKSFKVTIYKDLKFSAETLNEEMKATMRDSFGDEWSPILRVRSKKGDHVYMNMRESGNNLKVLFVKVNNDEAVVVRAKFNPEKLASFIDNPRIFGISLSDKDESPEEPIEPEPKPALAEPEKPEEPGM